MRQMRSGAPIFRQSVTTRSHLSCPTSQPIAVPIIIPTWKKKRAQKEEAAYAARSTTRALRTMQFLTPTTPDPTVQQITCPFNQKHERSRSNQQ